MKGTIIKISGPLVVAKGMTKAGLYDVVKVGQEELTGEIIEIRGDMSWIQVYEETSGIRIGEPVESTGQPLSVELAPGLLGSFYDGIQRPLRDIAEKSGIFINRGVSVSPIDREKKWKFEPSVKKGDAVVAGDVIGIVKETEKVTHPILVPPQIEGTIESIEKGSFTIEEEVATVKTEKGLKKLTMLTRWPVRTPRPVKNKAIPEKPLITGCRVIDSFFPISKGGSANIPGAFGTGKSVTQHMLAKWSNADIIIYVGCGERGNEMTEALLKFPKLEDPYTGRPLMERTILIANTSNMPIAAREASVYTGITLAEYYRDLGYDVALMADSTSRWAEAMREISGRLEEMPGEEGFPAYLASRISQFYERGGNVITQGSEPRSGSITVIGAISPPGGDFSEPVSQASFQVSKTFWSLDKNLAYARHYPSINWLTSYTNYHQNADLYYEEEINHQFPALRSEAMVLLQRESELQEIIKIVGADSLSPQDQLLLQTAQSLREDFLQQNAFDPIDTFTSLKKQYLMLSAILTVYHTMKQEIEGKEEVDIEAMFTDEITSFLSRMKMLEEKDIDQISAFIERIPKLVIST
ncbi:MAG: V-type ATP synthase subunit A [Patescibacteria group bacterium]